MSEMTPEANDVLHALVDWRSCVGAHAAAMEWIRLMKTVDAYRASLSRSDATGKPKPRYWKAWFAPEGRHRVMKHGPDENYAYVPVLEEECVRIMNRVDRYEKALQEIRDYPALGDYNQRRMAAEALAE